FDLAAIPLEWNDQRGIFIIEELEASGQNANDLARLAVHGDGTANHRSRAAELLLPVSIGEHDGRRCGGCVVLTAEQTAERRLDAEQLERAVGDIEAAHMLRL